MPQSCFGHFISPWIQEQAVEDVLKQSQQQQHPQVLEWL
jgi:hypothetical protein